MIAPQCSWHQEDVDDDMWQTQCGHYFVFNEGGPVDNEFEHCPFCGKHIDEHTADEHED